MQSGEAVRTLTARDVHFNSSLLFRMRQCPVSSPSGSTVSGVFFPNTSKVVDASKSSEARHHLPHTSSSHCRENRDPVSLVIFLRGQDQWCPPTDRIGKEACWTQETV